MRVLVLLLCVALAGCFGTTDSVEDLQVYRFAYPGSDVFVPGVAHGWLFQVTNPTQHEDWAFISYGAARIDVAVGNADPVAYTFDPAPGPAPLPHPFTVAPGESVAVLVNILERMDHPTGFAFAQVHDGVIDAVEPTFATMVEGDGAFVLPGYHIETATVGVWTNGTSFYTNVPDLLLDPAFPAGGNIDRAAALDDAALLPIYVYDLASSEQPAGSKDTCHFTTIFGYNDLLKHQAVHSTGVRLLDPDEAYTREGAEQHFLYGDALVFLNTVVALEGVTGPQDMLPQPGGACFNAQNSVPNPPVPPFLI